MGIQVLSQSQRKKAGATYGTKGGLQVRTNATGIRQASAPVRLLSHLCLVCVRERPANGNQKTSPTRNGYQPCMYTVSPPSLCSHCLPPST